MNIFLTIQSMIRDYGCDVSIFDNDKVSATKAFVQPLRYKNRVYIGGRYHEMGLNKTDKYLYIGQVENKLTENHSIIEAHNHKYIVKRCEVYYVKDIPVYVWAILAPYGAVLEDEYESN